MLANAASANYHLMDICRKIIFCDQDYHFRFKLQKLRTNQKSNNLLITLFHLLDLHPHLYHMQIYKQSTNQWTPEIPCGIDGRTS